MSFTDQKPRVATTEDIKSPWGGHKGTLRCYLCGHKFKTGQVWRWVFSETHSDFLVCELCDGNDVKDRWIAHVKEYNQLKNGKYWYFCQ